MVTVYFLQKTIKHYNDSQDQKRYMVTGRHQWYHFTLQITTPVSDVRPWPHAKIFDLGHAARPSSWPCYHTQGQGLVPGGLVKITDV